MAALLAVLAILFGHIHLVDVRTRVVLVADVGLLAFVRVAVCTACAVPGADVCGIAVARWGLPALARALVAAIVVVAALEALAAVVGRAIDAEAMGRGDALLYAACCSYLGGETLLAFLAASACAGVALGALALGRGERTFAFAPAIVWPCWVVLAVEWAVA